MKADLTGAQEVSDLCELAAFCLLSWTDNPCISLKGSELLADIQQLKVETADPVEGGSGDEDSGSDSGAEEEDSKEDMTKRVKGETAEQRKVGQTGIHPCHGFIQ